MDGTDLVMSASRIVAGGQLQRHQWESWNWKFMFSCKQLVSSEHCFMERAGWVGEEGGLVARAWISSVAAGMIISDVLFALFMHMGRGT